MAKIKVQKAHSATRPQNATENLKDVIATFCFYYPAYTYEAALDVPIRTVRRMLRIAKAEQARYYREMASIVRAGNAEKPKATSQLIKQYERDING